MNILSHPTPSTVTHNQLICTKYLAHSEVQIQHLCLVDKICSCAGKSLKELATSTIHLNIQCNINLITFVHAACIHRCHSVLRTNLGYIYQLVRPSKKTVQQKGGRERQM